MDPRIFLALVPPFLYSISNYIDQYLVYKYGDEDEEGGSDGILSLLMVSSLFSFIVLLVAVPFFGSQALSLPIADIVILVGAGVVYTCVINFYLHALNHEDSAPVNAWWLLVPLFSGVLSWLILGETLGEWQLISGIVVLVGVILMNINPIETGYFNKKVLLYMISGALLFAITNVLFKFTTGADTFFAAQIWRHVGILLFGIGWYLTHRRARKSFHNLLATSGGVLLGFNALNESITVFGDTILQYAILFGPVALGEVFHGTQIVWVFVLGLILYQLYPHMFKNRVSGAALWFKVSGLVILLGGVSLLLLV